MTLKAGANSTYLDIWFLDAQRLGAALEAEELRVPRLAADEISRAAAMKNGDVRRTWRVAHIALRRALEARCGAGVRGLPYRIRPGGRPELEGSGVSFSLSHSGDAVLIAVGDVGPIGIDIETMRARPVREVLRRDIETLGVTVAKGHALPEGETQRFLQAWTRIEAVAKAHGGGALRLLREGGFSAAATQAAGTFEVRDLDLSPGYLGAVAAPRLPAAVRVETVAI